MPKRKDPWTYKKRRKTKKAKKKVTASEAELIVRSRLPDPDVPSTSIRLSDISLNEPVKNEYNYPDTRFQRSTTLFPAEAVKENCLPSETPCEISKRSAEEELISTSSKKLKISSDSTEAVESTISEDVTILEAPKKQVKIEVIDLTDASRPIDPILCSPVRTSYLQNRLPGKPNTALQGIGEVRVKVEQNKASENSSELSTDKSHVDINKSIHIPLDNPSPIELQRENNVPSESNNNVNIDESAIVPPFNNHIEIKTEQSRSNESHNEVNFEKSRDDASPHSDTATHNIDLRSELHKGNEDNSQITGQDPVSNTVSACITKNASDAVTSVNNLFNAVPIKVEQNEVSFEKSNDAVSPHTDTATHNIRLRSELHKGNEDNNQITDTATHNIRLRSELHKGNEDNNQITGQDPVSNTVSACITKNVSDAVTSVNHLFNAVPIKVEQNENCLVRGNSASVSNLFSDGMSSVDLPVNSDQNKTYENCESSDNYLPVRNPQSVCSTKIPSDILYGTEHLSNVINKQQTEKKINDWVAHYSVNNEEAQRNVVYDENNTGVDSTVNCLLTAAQTGSELEKMDFQENSCNYEKSQNHEDLSQKSTNSNNESIGLVPSETLISDQLNRISISPVTDGGIFDGGDSQLYKPGTFRTPLLKYFNCNTKADILQVSHVRSVLSDLIKDKEEVSVIGSEVISDSQSNLELSVVEKGEELSNLQVSEKQALNSEVEEILQKMSSWPNWKEFLNLQPNVTNLDSNSASSRSEEFIIEGQVQNSLNGDGLGGEKLQNSSPNRPFESPSNMSEYSHLSHSDSRTIYCHSPMDIESPLRDNCPSTDCLSSLDDNKQSGTSKNPSMKAKTTANEDLFSKDFLRQILGNAKSTENSDDIANVSTSSSPSLDPVNKSNITIDESVFENLRQIDLFKNKPVEDTNSASNVNEKNSDRIMKNAETLPMPTEIDFKRARDAPFNPSDTCADTFEVPPKRVKISEDASISKSNGIKRLSVKEYMQRDSRVMDSPRYPSDHYLTEQFASESPSNSCDSSPGFSNFEHNMFTSPASRQNRNLPICSDTSLQNPSSRPMVNTSHVKDPRLARNYSPSLYEVANSQKQLGSRNISQTYPSQNVPEASKSSVHPPVKQNPSISTFNTMRNSSNIPSAADLFRPTVNNRQAKHAVSELNSIHPSGFNQRTSEKDRRVLVSSPPSESRSFSMAPNISDQSFQGVRGRQSLISFPHIPENVSSLAHHHYSSGSVNRKSMLIPPLPASISPPPLPPTPPIAEQSFSIASNRSPNPLHQNYKKLAAAKNSRTCNQSSSEFSFVSLLSKQLTEDIGRKLINTDEVYLIIIERNIDWILGIDREIGTPRISQIGGEFQRVRDSYANYLMYYNTYFPLLLLECFSKISTALKSAREKEKTVRHVCKVVHCKTLPRYVSFTCDSFIGHSDVENIPKDGHIVLVKFATKPTGNVRMLGYVCSSGTRAYSHKHDHGHEILKRFPNLNKLSNPTKIKITFFIAFAIPGIDLDEPIQIIKLTSIKKALMLNEALRKLEKSPLCDAVLSPRDRDIKCVALPRRQDTSAMTTLVQGIVETLDPSSPQLTIVRSAPFADSFLAIVQIVEEMQKFRIPGKILVCVGADVLNQMGMNLIETSSNVVIINREKESLHGRLQGRILDVMASHYVKALDISEEEAKIRVLQETEVLLVVTGTCFYEDVKCMAKDLAYCIIHDAHSFTEPESLLPLLYEIRHLLLFGDPDESCRVSSKCAANLGYNKSLFHRAYNLC
ncbi:hypothetical protein AVEN_260274-1 [Araneus ventricosus]|uniref:Uncharacterized protein n=1 Tax=Araneus ventricosus TaxID=182803 RepID=A0A4Y2FLS6_ARAVE|nr:hypothetical protein AVEN_260274-1 [Araneus ventricosus]